MRDLISWPSLLAIMTAVTSMAGPVWGPNQATSANQNAPLVVGWSDEFNSKTNWEPFPPPHKPDVSMRRKGFLTLSLGEGAEVNPKPAFIYATVFRRAEVDVERYPILAIRAVDLKGPSWWDVTIGGYGKDGKPGLAGKETKTPSLDHDGIILFDLAAEVKNGLDSSSRVFRIRLNVAGVKKGGSVAYDWIRFIRREDAERLRSNPNVRELVVEP
jgi:hypothetical protein